MLMHQGIGLDRFNTLPHSSAVHAMFECCGNVIWAVTLVDARPYPDRDALLAKADLELLALSPTDLDRALEAVVHEGISHGDPHCVTELARITRERIATMLGPAGGYPEY
ncbi:2-oxo-4-hydroxy-4-carboxy-5-ureidoimidazoline decarboxylase [Nocardia lijiangensis]|uniref:2-oxo-4-hydroxy-4-carboxy-5-ureidoimidazoline decarboxylase n=1 Tax=Nocardia lijiangensis TaxID=299618 RepID=UPI003D726925